MIKTSINLLLTILSCSLISCNLPSKKNNSPQAEDEKELLSTHKGWVETTRYGELPSGITIYKSPAVLENKNAQAYIAIIDMEQGRSFEIEGLSGAKTPNEFYEETKYPIIINAGYFGFESRESVSLISNDSKILSPTAILTRNGKKMYPPRGAFGLFPDGTFKADWVFTNSTPWDDNTFSYTMPSEDLQIVPSTTYPTKGTLYKPIKAIGAGPVLIKDGEIKNTHVEELFDEIGGIGPTIDNPRTAIGVTSDNKLILFVCEGRNKTADTPGYTLLEVAKIMHSLGCVESLNLDGGGSSCMLVNGKETIIPSDSGKQRPVVTIIGIK